MAAPVSTHGRACTHVSGRFYKAGAPRINLQVSGLADRPDAQAKDCVAPCFKPRGRIVPGLNQHPADRYDRAIAAGDDAKRCRSVGPCQFGADAVCATGLPLGRCAARSSFAFANAVNDLPGLASVTAERGADAVSARHLVRAA